jgi:hypothetical protein
VAATRRASLGFLVVLVVLLLSGTLKIGLLTSSYGRVKLPLSGLDRFQEFLNRIIPFDTTRGQEGVTVQGAILIGLLVVAPVAMSKYWITLVTEIFVLPFLPRLS